LLTFAAILELLAIVLWTGGLAVLSLLVAPALFQLASSRTEAGRIFGALLKRFHGVAYACGLAILLAGGLRWLGGYRVLAAELVRYVIVVLMLALAAYSGFVLTPKIEKLRAELGNAAKNDARREQFNSQHRLATTLMVFQLVLGLALVVLVGWGS
jgi:uncharacterized membrane protein